MKKITTLLCAIALVLGFGMKSAIAHDQNSLMSPKIEKRLDLTSEQSEDWDRAREKMQQVRLKTREYIQGEHAKLTQLIERESRKSEPDLAKIFKTRQNIQEKLTKIRSERESIELGLYKELTSEQKQIVFECFQKRLQDKKGDKKHKKDHA